MGKRFHCGSNNTSAMVIVTDNQKGVTGVPLDGKLPGKLVDDMTIGMESPGFSFDSTGLKR